MKAYKINFTDKFPFLYIVELGGWSISTTKEESWKKLVEYCTTNNVTTLTNSLKFKLVADFTIKMMG